MAPILHANSVTKLPPEVAGSVLVAGSHGGVVAMVFALRGGVRGCILNDAGIGRDGAGVGGLAMAERLSVAAACASHLSCRIGDAADMWARGTISRVNAVAAAAGVAPGMACAEAAGCMAALPPVVYAPPPLQTEARREIAVPGQRRIVLIDSASMVRPDDAGAIVVTGSHGALVGGAAAAALAVAAFCAVFNDAGGGVEGCGIMRLPALDDRGIAGLTVAASSARIGDALSSYEEGVVSAANQAALALGVRVGAPLRPQLDGWARR